MSIICKFFEAEIKFTIIKIMKKIYAVKKEGSNVNWPD